MFEVHIHQKTSSSTDSFIHTVSSQNGFIQEQCRPQFLANRTQLPRTPLSQTPHRTSPPLDPGPPKISLFLPTFAFFFSCFFGGCFVKPWRPVGPKFFAPHLSGLHPSPPTHPPFGSPHPSGPTPFGAPPFWSPPFGPLSNFGRMCRDGTVLGWKTFSMKQSKNLLMVSLDGIVFKMCNRVWSMPSKVERRMLQKKRDGTCETGLSRGGSASSSSSSRLGSRQHTAHWA